MKHIICLIAGLAFAVPAVADETSLLAPPTATESPAYQRAKHNKLIRGSTSLIVPNKLLAPEKAGYLSHYDELRINQTERQMRVTKQYLHYSGDIKDASRDDLTFGFRENQNEKKVRVVVDLARQQATFSSPDFPERTMRVATGSASHSTSKFIGCYEPKWTTPMHRSREFNGAAMPNASFFIQTSGIAIHQGNLGGRSHGCVRMSHADSRFVMDQINKFTRKVRDPITGRNKTVYDAEVCIVSGATAGKSPRKSAGRKPIARPVLAQPALDQAVR